MRILAALLFCSTLHAANWIALRTPGFELYTDASEKSARAALNRLANIRRLLPDSNVEPVPLRVVLFASARDYRSIAPLDSSSGFYQSGPERDYIVMTSDAQLPRVVVHEYVHFALNVRGTRRPMWIEEGLAEFYSNAQFSATTARLGAPIPEHLDRLAHDKWLTPAQLEAGISDSLFYAHAWALVHMFRHQPLFPEHLTDEDLTDLRRYLRNLKMEAVPAPPSISAPKVVTEPISALDVLLLRGDLALRTQHPALARTFYDQAAREFPNSSTAAAGLGAMHLLTGDVVAARKSLQHAIEINDRDPAAWFQLGLLDHDDAALARAAELNPNLGEAHLLLGVHATDDNLLPLALNHLQQAVRLMPLKSYAWYSLAFAQTRATQNVAARESLQRALHTANTPEQRKMAETLVSSLDTP